LALPLVFSAEATMGATPPGPGSTVRITVVYNNVPHAPGLTAAWGFAAIVESGGERILFDTGGDGPTLLGNLARLGIEPESVDAVVLSHGHADHSGGLDAFLARRPAVTVYSPESLGEAFRQAVERRGARVETVSGPRRLRGNLYSTGEMGKDIREQALIIDTPSGLVLMTGCAHPDVVAMTGAARAYRPGEIRLLMGGFHLRAHAPRELEDTLQALRALGVRRVAPSHCTGERAIDRFRELWGQDFVEGGCGAVIELP
jgi:7,8-dihydropterin-6-yl-methyl-4-(beta-D-ribofuranosyl)aminobenzene 5'-phosphate synthase